MKKNGVAMFSFRKTSCSHEQITPNISAGYCPDCGEYVKNQWVITRCACCGLKQKSKAMRGKVTADARYCRNCGSDSFLSEALEQIDIVNINYAVLLKETVQTRKQSFIQTWIDENTFTSIKLLPSY